MSLNNSLRPSECYSLGYLATAAEDLAYLTSLRTHPQHSLTRYRNRFYKQGTNKIGGRNLGGNACCARWRPPGAWRGRGADSPEIRANSAKATSMTMAATRGHTTPAPAALALQRAHAACSTCGRTERRSARDWARFYPPPWVNPPSLLPRPAPGHRPRLTPAQPSGARGCEPCPLKVLRLGHCEDENDVRPSRGK